MPPCRVGLLIASVIPCDCLARTLPVLFHALFAETVAAKASVPPLAAASVAGSVAELEAGSAGESAAWLAAASAVVVAVVVSVAVASVASHGGWSLVA